MTNSLKEKEIELLEQEHPFDPTSWLSEEFERKGINEKKITNTFERKKKFDEICSIIKGDLTDLIERESDNEKKNEWLERQHDAIIGDPNAMSYFINKIKETLQKRNITSVDYPEFYNSLEEAIFHEVWGKSVLAKWENRYQDSEACVIRGTELWIDINGHFERKGEFENEDKVKKIIEAFKMRDENAVLNHQQPELETEKEDGSRITMIIHPRSKETYVIFRRFIVKNFSLEEQAKRNTIPHEDVDLYRLLARLMCNMIVAGRVRSAKSTFMKTLISERDPRFVVACLEKHFELALGKHMPDRLIYELQASEGDLHQAIPRLLRMEHDYLIVGEIRSKELEAAMIACERGERGMMSTYHLTDVQQIVPQLTRHLLDEFPTRRQDTEEMRVAQNIDFILTMGTDRDRTTKRVTGLTEVIWDPRTRSYDTNTIIKYNKRDGKYYYSSQISRGLQQLMADENEEDAIRFLSLLQERERKAPIREIEEQGVLV
ncbi:ATPase, T2SS/T4P/T4SS family [Desertibacillus haloalkaliphilus]|uniref:ATPase, T2SS/T4P/T4SS family n=1 Tax=Desertibacillus haloalkaliphilus TaxID=1328930 RepID=UPI001C26A056|nr:ATPase, T2SS/T4P/T4SS family [Desertibacillus haloalkaliphilus]MBU8908058.1 CpaF/VirB11 family protein [Desertibacillus haloalkaliphilus]